MACLGSGSVDLFVNLIGVFEILDIPLLVLSKVGLRSVDIRGEKLLIPIGVNE